MAELIIFGGTAEGRELAEYAADLGLSVLVSVTSEYGKRLLMGKKKLDIRCGHLDKEGICRLLEKEAPRLVLDATHPYAVRATSEISSACQKARVTCLRVKREELDCLVREERNKEYKDEEKQKAREEKVKIYRVHTGKEAADILAKDCRPVLFTTGSKELAYFAAAPHLKGRIFARVLPDSKVISACEEMGIAGRQIMAMQGPFSVEMNCAMIRMVNAGWLVTKESGGKGGFAEKLEAAEKCRISVIVIGRPTKETGISPEEAKTALNRLALGREQEQDDTLTKERAGHEAVRKLSLIGMGMGGGRQLTLEAADALRASDAVLGASRMLEGVKTQIEGKYQEEIYTGERVLNWLKTHKEYSQVAVIYSGDTGFYSGCSSLICQVREEKWDDRLDIQIYPGISTLSCLCARLQTTWENIYPASVHGRDCDVEGLLRKYERVFLLLGGRQGLDRLCRRLTAAGLGRTKVHAGIRLGYPDEQILSGQAEDFQRGQEDSLAAVILERQQESR